MERARTLPQNLERESTMKRSISTSALPLCLLLSACGGDGTSTVENIPPPPVTPAPTRTPTPTIDVETSWLDSPATRVGSYDAIAIVNQSVNGTLSSRFAPPAEFRIEASQGVNGTFLYKLSGPSGFLPGQLSNITLPVPRSPGNSTGRAQLPLRQSGTAIISRFWPEPEGVRCLLRWHEHAQGRL